MLNTAHPSTYSIYWEPEADQPKRRPYALLISLAAMVAALFASGTVVASQFSKMPDPATVAVKNIDTGTPPVGYDTTVTALPGATRLSSN